MGIKEHFSAAAKKKRHTAKLESLGRQTETAEAQSKLRKVRASNRPKASEHRRVRVGKAMTRGVGDVLNMGGLGGGGGDILGFGGDSKPRKKRKATKKRSSGKRKGGGGKTITIKVG